MADDLGAVRRTPRPTPHPRPTGDRQTPETVAQPGAGTTNSPTLVSTDAGNGTDDLSPEVSAIAEALANLRGRMMATAAIGGPDVTDDALEAFAALPDCTACGGTGKDDHGSPFEAPLAVHFAAPEVEIAGRRRQLCLWCGHVLIDVPLADGQTAWPPWPKASLVRVEDGTATLQPYTYGDPLPPGCCALPDDDDSELYQPSFPQARCAKHADRTEDEPTPGPGCCTACNGTGKVETGYPCEDCYATGHSHPETVSCDGAQADAGPDEAQETRAAADWPAETVDTPAEGDHA